MCASTTQLKEFCRLRGTEEPLYRCRGLKAGYRAAPPACIWPRSDAMKHVLPGSWLVRGDETSVRILQREFTSVDVRRIHRECHTYREDKCFLGIESTMSRFIQHDAIASRAWRSIEAITEIVQFRGERELRDLRNASCCVVKVCKLMSASFVVLPPVLLVLSEDGDNMQW